MKKQAYFLFLLPLLFACSGTNTSSYVSSSSSLHEESSSSNKQSSSSTKESSSLPEVQYLTINMDCFEEYSSGYRFADHTDELLDLMNSNLVSFPIKALTVENCFVQVKESKEDAPHPYFTLGSGSYGGELTLLFDAPAITSIKVDVEGYSKYIAYNDSYSYDENFSFTINEKEIDLSGLTRGEIKTVTCDLPSLSSHVSLKTLQEKSRLFIHSISIGYYLL